MSVIVTLPVAALLEVPAGELAAQIGERASRTVGRSVQAVLPANVSDQFSALRRSSRAALREGYRDRGVAFEPHLHALVSERHPNSAPRWPSGVAPSVMRALFPHGSGELFAPQPVSAEAAPAPEEPAQVCLGFGITVGTMILLGSVGTEGSSVTFNVLSPSGNPVRAPVVHKLAGALRVDLPNGNAVEVPAELVWILSEYLQLFPPDAVPHLASDLRGREPPARLSRR